jgi:CBS domain containing-hemolysin-like protein
MVPRTAMVAFELGTSVEVAMRAVIESGHSRYPIYRGDLDHVEGVLYAKDLFRKLHSEEDKQGLTLAAVMRTPVFFAVESQKIDAVLREMQARRSHLAIVVDEFGVASGLVTLEDVLEELVGEIQDEHDQEEPLVHQLGTGHYEVDAGISVYDLEQILDAKLGSESGDFDSLGGLIVAVAGRVPPEGERVTIDGYVLIVLEADERRVVRVELVRRESDPGASEDEAQAAAG